jgi:3-dehydroquinate dehydratase/shikimate dehydrogenase
MNTRQPLICETVTARRMADLRARRDAAGGADLVEVRLDSVPDPDVDGALLGRTLPIVVTCRPRDEGGGFQGSEAERRALLLGALDAGADFVDLEWGRGFDAEIRRRNGRNVVFSTHDFEGIPADLDARVDAMVASGAEVVKVAVMVSRVAACARLAAIARRHPGRRLVLIAMGEAGVVTRICPERFGSCWTYAGAAVAPGQISVDALHREFGFRRIGAHSAIYGIAGRPVGHSLSPAMHNAAFEALGVDAVYVPLAVADVPDLFESAEALGLAGASVTAPYKVAVMAGLAGVDPLAAEIGAVNTLVKGSDGWQGRNTDAQGFLAGLADVDLRALRVAVLGTGGAARAVAVAARQSGAVVTCYVRDARRVRAIAETLHIAGGMRPVPRQAWDVLVNATPVGTWPAVGTSAFPEGIYDGRIVYDLVYNPPITRLMRDAALEGCRTIGGIEMLVAQAQRQMEHWTGCWPEDAVMRDAARWKLSTLTDRT